MISLSENRRIIQELKDKWDEELSQWDDLQKEIHELRNINFLNEVKEQLGKDMYNLIQELLSCRYPSPSYQVFLYEQMVLFKIRALKEGIPYLVFSTPKFLDTFIKSDFQIKICYVNCFCMKEHALWTSTPIQFLIWEIFNYKRIYFICYQSYALAEHH